MDHRNNPNGLDEHMTNINSLITGPAGQLEMLCEGFSPDSAPKAITVVCHPHPLHGGTMTNKVVHYLARSLRDLGLATIRFNFRGVGNSSGKHAQAIGETDDLLAVIDWVQEHYPDTPLWLAGFSFGAYVALRGVSQRPIERLITIAPAVHLYDFSTLNLPECPWLLIQGNADEVVPPAEVVSWIKGLDRKPRTIYLKGVGHFFHGKLTLLREVLVTALGPAAKNLH